MHFFSLGCRCIFVFVALIGLSSCTQISSQNSTHAARYRITESGVIVYPIESTVKTVQLRVYGPNLVRVNASPNSNTGSDAPFLMVSAEPQKSDFKVTTEGDVIVLKTAQLKAQVSTQSGVVEFYRADGTKIVAEANPGIFQPVSADPNTVAADSFATQQEFERQPNEAFYGLGQQQNGLVNYADTNVEMTTHNLEISIPLLVSSRNYGILWNSAAVSRFGAPSPAAPLADGFILKDQNGHSGGLTVNYYDGDTLLLSRVETDTDYQYLDHGNTRQYPFPAEVADAEQLRIQLKGSITAKSPGLHTLKMYSSGYAKLYIDGQLQLDRWRMNWNPWYHNMDLEFSANESKDITVEWSPNGGYFHLLQYSAQQRDSKDRFTLSAESAKNIDYFVIDGHSADDVIAGYRTITGKAVLLPKWAYGFWQSRERYKSQDELLSALKTYRDRKIPIDNIVLDWSYWPEDAWGSHEFDSTHFPDPKKMVDEVHKLHANIMISVWPKFYTTTQHFKELEKGGHIFTKNITDNNLDWIGKGYLNGFYDSFSAEARAIYWKQLNETLNPLGFDAWWLDAVEPDMHSNLSVQKRKDLLTPNALGNGTEYFNAYALPHAEGVYQGDRTANPEQRVFILTRSGFAGIQRTASAIWSGDIVSRWSNLKEQIAAGIGVGLSGMPNWTLDIGGFTPEDRYRYNQGEDVGASKQMDPKQFPEWQELNVRWFEFGSFLPLFRSHGQSPYREIFNLADEGSPAYNSLVWHTQLRYRLMPYIYSQAGDMYHKDATLMRGLIMDFGSDPAVKNISDQYMFGPALLINPVYEYKARNRKVYLPTHPAWYDFYTGERFMGGQTIDAKAPLNRIPVFVKAGSIIPTGAAIEYVDQKPEAPITLNVYMGADGQFELYEDDGESYAYESGAWSRIPFSFNNASKTLTIGKRRGSYPNMIHQREFHIRVIKGKGDTATDFDRKTKVVQYNGAQVDIQL